MKIIAYPTQNNPPKLIVAPSRREWMDKSPNKFAYRCLPLSMANSFGWQVLSNSSFIAEWNGGKAPSDVKITKLDGTDYPSAHFGEGTITWHLGYLFKTEHPYGMYMTGAPNNPKPNIIPMSGLVETHWLPYTATMNWQFTQPGTFRMEIGEPFCQLFPVDMSIFDNIEAEIKTMHAEDSKEFHELYWEWNLSRSDFIRGQQVGVHGHTVWQKNYFQGTHPPDGVRKCPVHKLSDGSYETTHKTKPGVPDFVDKTIEPYKMIEDYWDKIKLIEEKYEKIIKNQKTMTEENYICKLP
jgi:hypothetical protein